MRLATTGRIRVPVHTMFKTAIELFWYASLQVTSAFATKSLYMHIVMLLQGDESAMGVRPALNVVATASFTVSAIELI